VQMPQSRASVVHGVLVIFALALIVKAGHVQLVQHDQWAARALRQQTARDSIPAPRGDIEDATGVAVARSRELVRLAVAPPEVLESRKLYQGLLEAGVPASEAKRAIDRKRKWVEIRGRFMPSSVAEVLAVKGVHAYSAGERVYVQSEGTRRLLGSVDASGRGVDGLELTLDSILIGEAGRSRTLRGAKGERFESPDMLTEPPVRGHSVRLTINQVLQDICDQAIVDATVRLAADGGDIVILEPHSGEIRCLASHRRGSKSGGAATILEPYEPGSTLKPFLVGRLLEEGKTRPDEVIETFDGSYEVAGRTITDIHKEARMTVTDVIRQSSNVGAARLSERLSDGELYRLYRDIGFGTATGLPYPSEAPGVLYEPRKWSKQSHASLAIGYELLITPLQLAQAYAAIANDGELMAPALIKEIRDADGTVVYSHRPRLLRRVFEAQTAKTLMTMLESVVDSGTAKDASLATFGLAGKSGTARRTLLGKYGGQRYTSTFVGLFPPKKPQYVVLVKLDNPRGTYYGGKTAAPVARSVIEAALAARDASLDWENLPPQRPSYLPPVPDNVVAAVEAIPLDSTGADSSLLVPQVALVDSAPEPAPRAPATFDLSKPLEEIAPVARAATVPDVRGLPLRVAVRELHKAGFRVQLGAPGGSVTVPVAGSTARTGTIVRLARP
jgi:cell division protein FtsI (penicillin-binding protein 3)